MSEETTKWTSQYGQDRWVVQALKGKHGGVFVECGAYNGIKFSNTYVLETRYNWVGVCIEPDGRVFEKLQANRKCITDNSCVGGERGSCMFAEAGTLGGVVDHYDPKHKQRLDKAHTGWDKQLVKKKMVLLSDVLVRHKAPPVMDFLSLDTEGSELSILLAFPFDQFAFRLAVIEHNNYGDTLQQLKRLMASHGYTLVKNSHGDGYFVNKKLMKGVV
jgi:FkbM family methyltransferase